MKSVLVSFPTSPSHPYLHKHVVFASWKLLSDNRYKVTPMIPTHRPVENNFHHIINDFMAGGFDFWLSIDDDNPPMKNPLDLIELDLDIIGCPTPVWHYDKNKVGERPVYWNAYKYILEKDAYTEYRPRKGLQMVDAIGAGCFLVAKRVFEDPEMRTGVFTRQLYPDGRVHKGNDISFSERARERGFNIYCHFDYPCMHFNTLELNEVVAAFRGLYEDG